MFPTFAKPPELLLCPIQGLDVISSKLSMFSKIVLSSNLAGRGKVTDTGEGMTEGGAVVPIAYKVKMRLANNKRKTICKCVCTATLF